MSDVRTLRNLLNGEWCEIDSSAAVPVTNPATGEPIAIHPNSQPADVDAVVESARRAFSGWRATSVATRAAILFRCRHLLTSNADELAAIITAENGKTIDESKGACSCARSNTSSMRPRHPS